MAAIIREGRFVIVQAVLAAFGRVTGEVGVSMMLGGNIRWYTRTMTTTIALDAGKGEFERALSLGLVLLAIALAVNFLSHSGGTRCPMTRRCAARRREGDGILVSASRSATRRSWPFPANRSDDRARRVPSRSPAPTARARRPCSSS